MTDRRSGAAAAWLLEGPIDATSIPKILRRLCERLSAEGVPIDRAAIFVRTLHPTVMGSRYLWERGGSVQVAEAAYAFLMSTDYRESPPAHVLETGEAVRRSLEGPSGTFGFQMLDDLKAEGFTDYSILPLPYTTGDYQAVSWATRRAGGFTGEDEAVLQALTAPLARLVEIHALRRNAVNLLSAYVGGEAGTRILQGAIRRGDVETICAVIVMADLRDFTGMSNRCAPAEATALVNAYFDAAIPAIEKAGGEILKLIGDGFLAIFRCERHAADEGRAVAAALEAARAIRAAVQALNRDEPGSWPIRYGLSVHLGDVQYGNIGSATRLDFTAIGPAVNLVARLQNVARDRGRDVVLSEIVATRARFELDDLGRVALKGFGDPERVFALP